jgi:cyclopropane fatty-acyl-phospholipid synthase-like methyltransferase
VDECGVTTESRILDVGCGAGRLLYGLIEKLGSVRRYVGIEVSQLHVEWLTEHLAPHVPFASFLHFDYANARYNAAGTRTAPILQEKFDCVVLISVFSHMRIGDVRPYLRFIKSTLAERGLVFLTAFVERDVPDETENPEGYLGRKWSGALHCVRYNLTFFDDALAEAGFAIDRFRYRKHAGIQTEYVVSLKG